MTRVLDGKLEESLMLPARPALRASDDLPAVRCVSFKNRKIFVRRFLLFVTEEAYRRNGSESVRSRCRSLHSHFRKRRQNGISSAGTGSSPPPYPLEDASDV